MFPAPVYIIVAKLPSLEPDIERRLPEEPEAVN
jgi:hypothetical protein